MDTWFDALYAYRQGHTLRAALRGANIPDIVIGCVGDEGQIAHMADPAYVAPQHAAFYTDVRTWSFAFDMPDFCEDLRQQLHSLVVQWLSRSDDPALRHAQTQLTPSSDPR